MENYWDLESEGDEDIRAFVGSSDGTYTPFELSFSQKNTIKKLLREKK